MALNFLDNHMCPSQETVTNSELLQIQIVDGIESTEYPNEQIKCGFLRLALDKDGSAAIIKFDYCPWCREQLSQYPTHEELAKKVAAEKEAEGYHQYRKRFVKRGDPTERPLTQDEYDEAVRCYNELVLLTPHAAKEHIGSLAELLLRVNRLLCFEVLL